MDGRSGKQMKCAVSHTNVHTQIMSFDDFFIDGPMATVRMTNGADLVSRNEFARMWLFAMSPFFRQPFVLDAV